MQRSQAILSPKINHFLLPQPSTLKLGNFENIEEEEYENDVEKRGSKLKRSESDNKLNRISGKEDELLEEKSPDPLKKVQESEGNFACTCGSALRTKIFENYDSISSIKPANFGENSGNLSKNESHDIQRGERVIKKLYECR